MRSLCLLLLALTTGCGTSGNLLFLSTNTIGLRITTSDPASNAAPNIIIGHASVKGVINPVRDDSLANDQLRDKAYSVIGITAAGAAATDSAMVTSSEWFATGRAADLLAMNPNTPSALSGTGTLTPEVLNAATAHQVARTFEAVNSVYDFLQTSQPRLNAEDQAIIDGFDGLHRMVEDLEFETFGSDGSRADYTVPDGDDWQRVRSVRQDLQNSIVYAERQSESADSATVRADAREAARSLRNVRADLDRRLLGTEALQRVWNLYLDIIEGRKDEVTR